MLNNKTRLTIKHRWALGDTVLLSALVRDIHREYPGRYEIAVNTHFTNIWWNNPYVTKFEPGQKARTVEVQWGDAIRWNSYAKYGRRREMKHILAWYHYDFERKTGIHVPVTEPKPDLHLSDDEKVPRVQGRYWVIVGGGKLDMTVKHWHSHRLQEVVDKLAAQGIHCVQVGASHAQHVHPPLRGVVNLVGKTENARDLFNIIMHAEGVICGVTAAMHIAAAFERPCVVYAGGREEPWFESYVDGFQAFGPKASPVKVPHRYLHTIGLLSCCDVKGCWKTRTVPLNPEDFSRKQYTLCRNPVRPPETHPVPACLDKITSDHVVEAVMDYYDKKILPPIQPPKQAYPTLNPELADRTYQGIRIPTVELIRVRPGKVPPPRTSTPAPPPPPEVKMVREPSVAEKKQKPHQLDYPKEILPKRASGIRRKLEIMDHPLIGGKITVFVLCYGNYPELARRCLSGILGTIPQARLDLRVAANAASPVTIQYLRSLPLTKLYVQEQNEYKYPVMRKMFYDETRPINTNYFVWFDDDTWVVRPQWIDSLCQSIIDNHNDGYRMYGSLMHHDISVYRKREHDPRQWFREANWYKGIDFRARSGQPESPNGSIIDFAVGWCWAMQTEAMKLADVPDVRLGHNGGDITIGEQMHQAGFRIKHWNPKKSQVACPSRKDGGRRGVSQRFPWDPLSDAAANTMTQG